MSLFRVAVDVMGGDHGPRITIAGALAAARHHRIKVLLVGREEDIRPELNRRSHAGLEVECVPAPETIGMEESPIPAIRKKKKSSIAVAARLIRDGLADGMVSAGNTGAVMAAAKLILGTIPGIDRPALTAVIPSRKGRTVILDVGANLDIKPLHYLQFAGMGYLYSQLVLGIEQPRIGLLTVGEEETKGPENLREAFGLLRESGLNFIGNIEGKGVFSGQADVIVCDGFLGNVSLKIMESTAEMILRFLIDEARTTLRGRLGFLIARSTLRKFRKRIDYAEYGGVPLLGMKGSVVVCHGRSSPRAIENAIRVGADFVRNRVVERIQEEIPKLSKQFREGANSSFPRTAEGVPAGGDEG